jgi:hypothetical protein
MAEFCRACTIYHFGIELADKNDMIRPVEKIKDDEMYVALCEGCGYGFFDNKGNRVADTITSEGGTNAES